jgi:2-iminobutanoate/2-iminopropanoate deaminase
MEKKIIFGERTKEVIGESFGPYSQGIKGKGGNLVFIGGQGGYVHGRVIEKGDIAAQYKQIMENMKAILEDAGGSMNDIVKLVNYVAPEVTPESKDYAMISEIRKQYIPESFPVSTMVQVVGFMIKEMLIEVDAIAVIG